MLFSGVCLGWGGAGVWLGSAGGARQAETGLICEGLETMERLLRPSTANCASCVRAGFMWLLLTWLPETRSEDVQAAITRLVEIIGGHSISGRDMSKIFSLLRSTKSGCRPRHATLLLRTLQALVKDDGPAVFFEFNGKDSVSTLTLTN